MVKGIRSFSQKLGVDRAIAYTVLARIIQAGGGVISIVFIAKYLNKIEQGYYYTFGSVLAIQIFFELGLSNIITQFVAHEMAHLQWKDKTLLEGDEEPLSRLSSLLQFCVKWFAVTSLVLVGVLIIAGHVFFKRYGHVDDAINWQMPWVILSISTALSLMVSPILAYLEGLSKVKEVAVIRLVQQSSQLFILFVSLASGLQLFASPLASLLAFTITPCWIYFSYKRQLLQNIWKQLGQWKVNYTSEIFPYQWRIALSWISGYFIFQLFNPVLFATEGSVVAGEMGMSLTALSGVLAISMSWINTKTPLFSNLIAKKDYTNLDIIFNATLKQASAISAAGVITLLCFVMVCRHFELAIGYRFLPVFHLALLCTSTFVNQFISGFATYLRCHKREPFLILSIVMGCLTAFSTLVFGRLYGLNGIVIGYCSLTVFVSLPWATIIFFKKKKLWHQ